MVLSTNGTGTVSFEMGAERADALGSEKRERAGVVARRYSASMKRPSGGTKERDLSCVQRFNLG